ncbi:efflux RND transporter periplasmic adaptor subunit [Arenibacter sp. N53]|uniref:efflux RND transporter periplasmic adaptor subunit n=1 Tax=Arenibacter TaxID=178469 RepID=UPI000CD3D6F1|nr:MULTISPECIES: efflux RND transporter periplasmic adaptor subunit [Arenibacter]MCM4153523.1 efflux RND transporter periplasmic adaptor subunit [Arenibacter sp. N53]
MNKNVLYIGIALIAGVLVGYLIFGGSTGNSQTAPENTNISDGHDHTEESLSQTWTCSMHPQIMQPEPGDCPICGMELIPVDTSADGLALNEIKMTKNAMALANIQTTLVGGSRMEDNTLLLSGKIMQNEEETSTLPAHYSGRIENLYVTYPGELVKKGQAVAKVYSPALVSAQQELITAYKMRGTQPRLYEAVRNKFKNWKIHAAQLDEVLKTGEIITEFTIYSHVSGVVTDINIKVGDHITDGHPIFKAANLNTVWAVFDAYESQISDLKEGQEVKISVNAYPNKEFTAKISFIDPILNMASRTIVIRAVLPNKENLFKPGMFVQGKVNGITNDGNETIVVPQSAVLWTGERSLVYIKTNPNEPVFEMREITLGNRNGDDFMVVSGLEIGDEIVTNGTFTVDAAAQLQGKKSMMNKDKITTETEATVMKMVLPQPFQESFKAAIDHYLNMKDAFVESNSKQVAVYAKSTSQKLKTINLNGLGKMEKTHLTKSIQMLDAIGDNPNLDNQRSHFVILNQNFVPLAKNTEGFSLKLYIQKCPMADNNKGAFWLSNQKEIRNPYYGEQMMSCGSIIDSIR